MWAEGGDINFARSEGVRSRAIRREDREGRDTGIIFDGPDSGERTFVLDFADASDSGRLVMF